MESGATFSPCKEYRYTLTRKWGDGEPLIVIGLNPSTADASVDDPTIRRIIGFAHREGAAGMLMLNLFALRSTKPEGLWAAQDPVGPNNDHVLREHAALSARTGHPIVCAWGNGGMFLYREIVVVKALLAHGARLSHFGLTKAGEPKHPLYLKGDTPLQPFTPEQIKALGVEP